MFQNDQITMNKISFRKTIKIISISILALSLCKIVKQSLQRIQSCEARCEILGPKWPICAKQEFFQISHYCNFHGLLAPFIVQNLKKTLRANPELWGWFIFGSKMGPFGQTKNFSENLLINLVPIVHAYLHSESRSQISIY